VLFGCLPTARPEHHRSDAEHQRSGGRGIAARQAERCEREHVDREAGDASCASVDISLAHLVTS